MGWGEINAAFGGGELAMYTSGSDVYNALVEGNGVTAGLGLRPDRDPDLRRGRRAHRRHPGRSYARTRPTRRRMPPSSGSTGGTCPSCRTRTRPSPTPRRGPRPTRRRPWARRCCPIFSKELYEENQGWIKDYINVPLDDMTGYTDVMFTQTLVPEAVGVRPGPVRPAVPGGPGRHHRRRCRHRRASHRRQHGRAEGHRRRRADPSARSGSTPRPGGRSPRTAPERKSVSTRPTVSGPPPAIAGVAAVPTDDVAGEPVLPPNARHSRPPGPAVAA